MFNLLAPPPDAFLLVFMLFLNEDGFLLLEDQSALSLVFKFLYFFLVLLLLAPYLFLHLVRVHDLLPQIFISFLFGFNPLNKLFNQVHFQLIFLLEGCKLFILILLVSLQSPHQILKHLLIAITQQRLLLWKHIDPNKRCFLDLNILLFPIIVLFVEEDLGNFVTGVGTDNSWGHRGVILFGRG